MVRKDKKNRTCDCCGKTVATPQKLRQHYASNKNQCTQLSAPIIHSTESSIINISESVPSQDTNLDKPLLQSSPVGDSPNHIPQDSILPKSANDRKPGETIKQWGSRLRKRYKELTYENYELPRTLKACQVLYDTLLQIDEEAYGNIEPTKQTKEEQDFFGEPEIESVRHEVSCSTENQVIDSPKSEKIPLKTDQTNEEFERLSMITGDYEKNIIFREQNLGRALKRRAVAVHNAKVSKFHPDNGSDIRKMLESQRKPFRELLEKEFDKRGQFKFSLCSFIKFLIDDKPGNNSDKKKNSRTDWLRNKQMIVYNRSEIDNYLSNAFEQILNQVEERGGRSIS